MPWRTSGIHSLLQYSLLILLPTVVICLRCYICENEQSNAICNNDFSVGGCEPGMDTCQTIVHYSDVSEKLSIIKTCTKNVSCDLQINATRDVDPCDKSLGSWVCTSCCYENFCNVDAAPSMHVAPSIHIFSLTLIMAMFGFVMSSVCATCDNRLSFHSNRYT